MLSFISIALIVPALFGGFQSPAGSHIDAGPLKLDIYTSETATLFHVVDQISEWSEFSHPQYRRYFRTTQGEFSDDDRALLVQHAAIRKKYGWGRGPEQAFYTALPLTDALTAAVSNGFLTKEEAQTEEHVLSHFQPRIEKLRLELQPNLEKFLRTLRARQEELTTFATDAQHFVAAAPPKAIPFYMIVNPDDTSIGGGYNAGIITLEIPRNRDVWPTLLHELFHAFIELKKDAVQNAIRGVPGLDFQTVNEGLAYALSPGLYHTGQGDALQAEVTRYAARQLTFKDSYMRFTSYALSLRPLLKQAFADSETLEQFTPQAIDAWRALMEQEKAPH